MAYFAPGHRPVTASASTWAVEWRSTCRPASVSAVTIATSCPSSTRRDRSTCCPSTTPATAALASFGPMAAATSPTVEPEGTALLEPSGSVSVMSPATGRQGTGALGPARGDWPPSAQVERRPEADHREPVGVLGLVDLPAREPLGEQARRVDRLRPAPRLPAGDERPAEHGQADHHRHRQEGERPVHAHLHRPPDHRA